MPNVIFVDSTFKKQGTDSDFQIELSETLNVEDGRMRVDKISSVNTFYTVIKGVNQYIYFYDPQNLQTWFAIPKQAYTGPRLAAAIQVTTGYTTTYNEPRNELRITFPNDEMTQ